MQFYADLHIHSRYSRATSKSCGLEEMELWARKKGLGVIATGDFTHPAWFAEIKEKLAPAGGGSFVLKGGAGGVRFILSVEISTIYKQGDKTRKVHHLVFVPDIASAERFRARLAAIGNIASDGRPILGLSSRNLLETALESGEGAYLVPAHIWTPWFSALGSKSGFDSIEECYGDLAGHIFAAETGLSSDPGMNWRVGALDGYRLVSNSDAHSPSKLAREATIFDAEPDYFSILDALKSGRGYVGTVEFFPEEGKYHADGHRKCGVCLSPEETALAGGTCPVCGKPLTIGVLNRVAELADRGEGAPPPPKAGRAFNLVPLQEIISEAIGAGAASKSVAAAYEGLISKLGSELDILLRVPVEDIAKAHSSILGEGIARLRRGEVIRRPGFDGEYGVIKLFSEGEIEALNSGGTLFFPDSPSAARANRGRAPLPADTSAVFAAPDASAFGREDSAAAMGAISALDDSAETHAGALGRKARAAFGLDEHQLKAVTSTARRLLISAGPGSGKTAVLAGRISHFAARNIVPAERCLAITFTRRAADEMRARIDCPANVHTFHSLCFSILKENHEAAGLAPDFSAAERAGDGAVSFDELVLYAARLLRENPAIAEAYRDRFKYISIDEYQDIDANQYELVRLLAPADGYLCAIGDPNQAIYGFRGGDPKFFERFADDYPDAEAIGLRNNYRSTQTIVDAASQMIHASNIAAAAEREARKITLHAAPTEEAEAEFVVKTIEGLIGGHSFYSIDTGRSSGSGEDAAGAFSDFAILYRTSAQAEPLARALARSGMPFSKLSDAPLCERKDARGLFRSLALASDQPLADRIADAGLEENISQYLVRLAREYPDKDDFMREASILRETDTLDRRADRISLMTLHASKGLEFKCVFIVGLEDGLLPFRRAEDELEERRLLYVGMTRAERMLFLCRAIKRKVFGTYKAAPASPFLKEIEGGLLRASEYDRALKKKDGGGQLALL
ncbi:MAG: UvrD-helicase domain-containing protein [Rickettsiales bacterium]|jgi:uncharacterized protein (TIGR00375 family)|nr:UvrD-helicase domain-containing protein [Rickettsiales bacterium]